MILAFLFGAFGAITAEILKRWQQWHEMPEKRSIALLKSVKFWCISLFLVLLGGTVACFEGTKTSPVDLSLCFFIGVGAMSTVRNFISGVAAAEADNRERPIRRRKAISVAGGGGGRFSRQKRTEYRKVETGPISLHEIFN
jgi:hypothetical protein